MNKPKSPEDVEEMLHQHQKVTAEISKMQSEEQEIRRHLTIVAMDVCPEALSLNMNKLRRFYRIR